MREFKFNLSRFAVPGGPWLMRPMFARALVVGAVNFIGGGCMKTSMEGLVTRQRAPPSEGSPGCSATTLQSRCVRYGSTSSPSSWLCNICPTQPAQSRAIFACEAAGKDEKLDCPRLPSLPSKPFVCIVLKCTLIQHPNKPHPTQA